jgi:hypothetical protein
VMIVMACQQKKRVIANPLLPPGGAVGGQYWNDSSCKDIIQVSSWD